MAQLAIARTLGVGAILVLGLVTACSSSDNSNSGFDFTAAPGSEWPKSDVTVGPLVSGTAAKIDGTMAWTDYVYDDRGPNTDDGDMTDIATAGGNAHYPDNLSNAADFVQVQISRSGEGVHMRVVLETLLDPAIPLVGIAFDTDNNAATGAARLPGSWAPDGALGSELLVVLADGAGEVLAWDGAQWQHAADLAVAVDPGNNTLDATLPPAVAAPGSATWNAIAVAGTTTDSWLSGAGVIHDLAFVRDEPFYQWQDYRQADILAGKAPVDAAIVAVDFGALADAVTTLPDTTAVGFHTYLYHSDLTLAEGIGETDHGPEYLGPYQPYLVYVPEGGFRAGDAITLYLHGRSQNHLGSVMAGDLHVGTVRPLSDEVGSLEQYARDGTNFPPGDVTVWPLARGPELFYQGIAEQDVLDVLADANLRLRPDPNRIILSGASMGGIGTFRMGVLYPDLWSVAVPIVGLAPDTIEPLLGNFEDLEIRQINGVIDPLIPMDLAQATTDRLDALGLRYQAWMLDKRGHEADGYVYECVYHDLPNFVRATNPPRVRYTIDPALFDVEPDRGLELVHNRAYWVSGMRLADSSSPGAVDAHSLALSERKRDQIVRTDERYEADDTGRDLCGPNPSITTGDTWRHRALEWIFGDELPKENTLVATLTNLAGATFDLARAGLGGGVAAIVRITTDTGSQIVLTGLKPGESIMISGATVTADADGAASISTPVGTSTINILAT